MLKTTISSFDCCGESSRGPSLRNDGIVIPGDSDWYNKHINPTAAARKRGQSVNPKSIIEKREYCGLICKKCNEETGKYEYFSTQVKGEEASCQPLNAPCPNDSVIVAAWHTHGGDDPRYETEVFSQADKDFSVSLGIDLYLITPKNKFLHYIPDETGQIINRGDLYNVRPN